jgi:RNA polymerase sigma-70 factor (ECF subfamily)
VIKAPVTGHSPVVSEGVLLAVPEAPERTAAPAIATPSDAARLRAMVDQHLDFTWRSLRRLGLSEDVADDATQRVFLVASKRLADIEAGSERAFLFNTALRVASSERRTYARRREVLRGDDGPEARDPNPAADELLDREQARAVLEELLDELAMDLRAVFVLFELEGLTMAEIAKTLEVPDGTVASRLRRARQAFQMAIKRHRARHFRTGGTDD